MNAITEMKINDVKNLLFAIFPTGGFPVIKRAYSQFFLHD